MRNRFERLIALVVVGLMVAPGVLVAHPSDGTAVAQEQDVSREVRFNVLMTRAQGEKELSRHPYEVLSSTRRGGGYGRLRMGVEVPIPGKDGGVTYQHVGVAIDVNQVQIEGDRVTFSMTVTDSQLYSAPPENRPRALNTSLPVIQTFSLTTGLSLLSGASSEFTVATDKVTGEVVRAQVTATIVK